MIENKSMHHIRIIFFLVFLLFSFEVYSQSENSFNPKIIPPSPTAYELGRYGQTDVGTFTGTPNISVPLYTYKTRNLSIPISLGYNSNGIQVDQMETNVGLGWNLNAGGIINRVVRGKPDEERYYPINEDDCFSSSFITYMDANQFNDTQPDLYSYNFQGHSGQFVFDKNNKVVLVPQNNLKIERVEIDLKKGFKIITDDGVEYYFFDKEYSTWENTDAPSSVLTGWYLSKIIHPAGDVVNFTYKDTNYSFTSNISKSLPVKMSVQGICSASTPDVNLWEQTSVNILSVMGKMIESISSSESVFCTLSFQNIGNPNIIGNFLIKGYQVTDSKQNIIENTVFNYLFPANQRIFLSECIFKDTSKKYSFEYEDPEGLAGRLSNAKDLWGFYNGKSGVYPDPGIHIDLYSSVSLVIDAVKKMSIGDKRAYIDYAKKGILKKIVYPTKGYNVFTYESNTVLGTITSPLEIADQRIRLLNPEYGSEVLNDSFEFENKKAYEGKIELIIKSDGYNSGNDVFPDGDVDLTVTVHNLANPGLDDTFVTTKYNKLETRTYKFLANTTYRISAVYTPGIKTTAQVNFSYCTGGGIESTGNIPVGGLRIQEIKTFDTDLNETDIKHYYYGPKNTPHISSGVEGVKMNLFNSTSINTVCAQDGGSPSPFYTIKTTNVMTLHPYSIYQLYRSNGNSSTTYRNVTVSHGGASYENGGEEFFYHASSDTKPSSCINNTINSAPWTNSSWDNGVLYKKIIFKKIIATNKLIDLNIIENKYKLEEQYTQEVVGLAYDFKFNPVFSYDLPDRKAIEHLNIAKYTTNSYWFYLESEKNTQNDVEGLNPVTTTTAYKYNNPLHKKLSSQTITTSTGEEIETKYFYPQDPEMASEPLRNELIAKNMIGAVLDTQTLRGGIKLSEQKTIYDQSSVTNNLLLPRYIGVNKGASSVDLSQDKKITYDQYDEKGNILQYTLESGIPVSIIWGYNKTQPIAKIENLAYNLIPSGTIANLQTLSNADNDNCMSGSCTEQLLRNGLNAFQNSLPDAFISTYTYNPLVGVTSVTDPKGIPSYYEYNTYGRLKFVKDKDLNVLQKYCYNYKGQQVDCNDNSSTTVILYKSSARSGSFTRNNCSSGGDGSTVVYSQAEGVSSSTISQADADSKGLDKFNTDGQNFANANGECIFRSAPLIGSFQKNNCTVGGVGSYVNYSLASGAVTLTTSQADVDAQAWTKFQSEGLANANAYGDCTFQSAAIASQAFQKNNCTVGGVGSYVNYSLPAGAITLKTSQADVDAQAWTKFQTEGLDNANAYGDCTFGSARLSDTFQKNNCTVGGVGSYVLYTLAAGTITLKTSQADVDAQAWTRLQNEGIVYANTYGDCTFQSAAIANQAFQKNNCTIGGLGSYVNYSLPVGAVTLKTSQADVDAQAWNKFQNEGLANANTYGDCTFQSAALSGTFRKNNCTVGGAGSYVNYSLPIGAVTLKTSQTDVDAQAWTRFQNEGIAYANTYGDCTFQSAAIASQAFQKNNCTIGGLGSYVNYSLPMGAVTLKTSQADVDAQAWARFQNEGIANANTFGDCTFQSAPLSDSFQKNNCTVGGVGSFVGYSLPIGAVTLKTSQADVDAQAWTKFQNEGLANANANGYCTFYSIARSGSFTRYNCPVTTYGSSVPFSQAAGVVTSTISQEDADTKGFAKFNIEGMANANATGICILPLPTSPTGLTLIKATATSLDLSWNAVVGAASYKIYKNGVYTGVTSSTNTSSLYELTPLTTYNIQVLAVNATGSSDLSAVVPMTTTSIAIINACTLNFSGVSGSSVMYKNGSRYLSADSPGSYSGTLGTGDSFYVEVNASKTYYKSITITSSVRGTLYLYGPNKIGNAATSATFTKVGSEVITIDCIATDMLD